MAAPILGGPKEETVFETQHFQVRIDESGKGLLERSGVNDMILDGYVSLEQAHMTVLAAETGYHHGVRDALQELRMDAKRLKSKMLGPISTPRGVVRPSTE